MATILHLQATVQPDGKIEISAPELQPGQRVSVTIETQEPTPPAQRTAAEVIAEAPGHQLFQTAEEVDAYIREERDSWDS